MTIAFPAPGFVLGGRYVLQGLLGEGRSSVVHLAAQPALAREVAIKIVPAGYAHALGAEAVAAARVVHAGSVAVHDAGIAPTGEAFLVMARARGQQLSRVIEEEPFAIPRAVAIADQILSVLEVAHDDAVVHGDLTVENLVIDETDRVVVLDYGEATCDERRPQTGISSDIRAAGLVLYEMITGRLHLPTRGRIPPMAIRRSDLAIPAALEYVVMRALDPDPQRRFPTAEAMRRSLRTIESTPAARTFPRSTQIPALSADGTGARRVLPPLARPAAPSLFSDERVVEPLR